MLVGVRLPLSALRDSGETVDAQPCVISLVAMSEARHYRRKYTRETLAPIVAQSVSVADVMRRVGMKKWTGGNHNLIRDRINEYELDTTHFTGQATNRGPGHSPARQDASAILVKRNTGRRQGRLLTRALIEIGVPYVCAECGLGDVWMGRRLRLEVDHKNGDRSDDRRENLRFMCPNCHSQTETFSNNKRDSGVTVAARE